MKKQWHEGFLNLRFNKLLAYSGVVADFPLDHPMVYDPTLNRLYLQYQSIYIRIRGMELSGANQWSRGSESKLSDLLGHLLQYLSLIPGYFVD